jgi:hypothetical protein
VLGRALRYIAGTGIYSLVRFWTCSSIMKARSEVCSGCMELDKKRRVDKSGGSPRAFIFLVFKPYQALGDFDDSMHSACATVLKCTSLPCHAHTSQPPQPCQLAFLTTPFDPVV